MPSKYEYVDNEDVGGYCWNCHHYFRDSIIIQVWEGNGRDEQDEFEGGHCPQCYGELDTEARCEGCGEADELVEYQSEGKIYLYCPECYILISLKHIVNYILENTEIYNKDDIIRKIKYNSKLLKDNDYREEE